MNMKRLKLFEEYSNDSLQEAQDFLDDCFANLMDIWSIPEGTPQEVAETTKEKIYFFRKDPNRRNVYLSFIFDTTCLTGGKWRKVDTSKFNITDFISDVEETFKKVKVNYPMSKIETGVIVHITIVPLYRVMIWLNVDGKNDGSF